MDIFMRDEGKVRYEKRKRKKYTRVKEMKEREERRGK